MSIFDRFKKEKEQTEKSSMAPKVKAEKKATEKKAPAKKTEGKEAKKVSLVASAFATKTLLRPVVSEKAAHLAERNIVIFRVPKATNRIMVRQAVRELYKVTPVRVNIVNTRGKAVRFGKQSGRTQDVKKAIVTLPAGTHLDIFEGV